MLTAAKSKGRFGDGLAVRRRKEHQNNGPGDFGLVSGSEEQGLPAY
jgi:hypothetical protein